MVDHLTIVRRVVYVWFSASVMDQQRKLMITNQCGHIHVILMLHAAFMLRGVLRCNEFIISNSPCQNNMQRQLALPQRAM